MPPDKRTARQTPRRSSRHTAIEDDEPSEAEEAAPNITTCEEEEVVVASTDTADMHQDTHHNEAMQEPESSKSANSLTHKTQEPTTDHAPDLPPSSSQHHPSRPREPAQRLTSILPASGTRSRPTRPASKSSATATASADLEPHADPSTRASALKFQPKSFVRRSKEEREAAEKVEAERRAARLAADAGTSTAAPGGRGGKGGRGRGRGGTPSSFTSGGQRGNASYDRSAGGVLGGASVVEKRARGRHGTQNGIEEVGGSDDDAVNEKGAGTESGGGKGKGKVKEEPVVKPEVDKDGDVEMEGATPRKRKRETAAAGKGKGKGKARVKKEDDLPTYISSEGEFDSDTAEKINIEAINLVSSEEEEGSGTELHGLSEVVKGKQNENEAAKLKTTERKKPKNWMMRPVHVERLEHVERETEVNTEASSLTSAGLRKKARERKEEQGGLFVSDGEGEGVGVGGGRKGRRKQKDVEFVRDMRRWKGVWPGDENEEEKVRVKDEPNDEEDVTVVDAPRALEKEDEVAGAEEMAADDVSIGVGITEIGGAVAKKGDPEGDMLLGKQDAVEQETSDEEGSTEMGSEEDDSGEEMPFLELELDDDADDDVEFESTDDDKGEESVLKLSLAAQNWQNRLKLSATSAPTETALKTDTKPPPAFITNDPEIKAARHRKTYLMQLPPLIPSLRDSLTKPATIKKDKKPKIETAPSSTNPFTAPHPMDALKAEGNAPPSSTAADNQRIPNAIHQPASASNFANGSAGTIAFHDSGQTLASWGDMAFEVSEREVGGLAQETVMMEYSKVVTKLEEQDRWVDVVTVGGDGSGDGEGRKVGYSGGAVKGGFCLLGA